MSMGISGMTVVRDGLVLSLSSVQGEVAVTYHVTTDFSFSAGAILLCHALVASQNCLVLKIY